MKEDSGKVVPVLVPLLDEAGRPVIVSPACIIEYLMKMAHGDAQVRAAACARGAAVFGVRARVGGGAGRSRASEGGCCARGLRHGD